MSSFLTLFVAFCAVYISSNTAQNVPPVSNPGPAAAAPGPATGGPPLPLVPPPPGSTMNCGASAQSTFIGPRMSTTVILPYQADVAFYLYGDQSITLSALRVHDALGAPLGTSQVVTNQGYLQVLKRPQGSHLIFDYEGTGNGPYWVMVQCTKITNAPTTAPPTPPPTPLPAAKLNIGKLRCGTGIIGQYGGTPQNTGTISVEITMEVVGSMALYINGLTANKLAAYLKPPPAGTVGVVPYFNGKYHPYHIPIAETSRSGTQYLFIPNMSPMTDVVFHIDLQGKGQYYAITNCRTPAPTMAPTSAMPTTLMPTVEMTTSGVVEPYYYYP